MCWGFLSDQYLQSVSWHMLQEAQTKAPTSDGGLKLTRPGFF